MHTCKSCQEKILSNYTYTGTNKACQGKLLKGNLLVFMGAQAQVLNHYPAYEGNNMNPIIKQNGRCLVPYALKGRLQSLLRMCDRFVMSSLLITSFQSHGVNENTRGRLNRSLLYCKERWRIKSSHKNCCF